MAEDYPQKVKDKRGENSALTTRQKEDEELLYLNKYVMKDASGKAVSDIINITLNRPAVFAANIISALSKTSEQRIVETEDNNLDTTEIEDFQKAAFASANDRLRRQGRVQLNPFFDTQNCIRGRSAARCVFQMVDDVLVSEIVPWDTRADYVTYEMGQNGLKWAANEGLRQKGLIEAQYEEELEKYNVTITKAAKVLDVWDTTHNEIWIAGKEILEQEHIFGFTPVCIQVVPLGYGGILLGDDRIKYEGESIFFLIRDVIPELNRLASIMQTLNLTSVKGPMGWQSKEGALATPPKYEDVTGLGTITATEMGGGAKPIDYGDAKRAAMHAYAMLDKALQEGSLSSIDLGTLQFQLSAVALIEIGEGRDQVFLPRLQAKAMLNEQLAEMFTRQVIQIGGSVELGTHGHKRSFQVSKLEGEYETTFEYFVKSPKVDAGLYTLAAAAGNLIPDKAKRRDILQREDPDGDEKQLRWEEAERLSPAIKINRTIRTLVEMEEDFEAELLSAEMGVNLKRMLAGDVTQIPRPEPEEQPKQVVPLLGRGGGGRTRPPTPEGEE